MFTRDAGNRRFFERVTAQPVAVLLLAFVIIAVSATGLTRLVKDTSVKAFIPAGHESLIADSKAADIFGLSDTIAVAVLATNGRTVFEPDMLTLLADISDELAALDNVRPDRIASLSCSVQVVDTEGRPLAINLQESGIKPLDEVIVVGTVAPRPNEEVLVVRATGIHRVGS